MMDHTQSLIEAGDKRAAHLLVNFVCTQRVQVPRMYPISICLLVCMLKYCLLKFVTTLNDFADDGRSYTPGHGDRPNITPPLMFPPRHAVCAQKHVHDADDKIAAVGAFFRNRVYNEISVGRD
jgi:hypothetical protein